MPSSPSVNVRDLFDTGDQKELAERFESYKDALNKATLEGISGHLTISQEDGRFVTKRDPLAELASGIQTSEISKAIDAQVLESLKTQLEAAKAAQADIVKDITLTSPLNSGLVPFDLEAPAKMLTPRPTPLRNRLNRTRGQGTARKFKRITGFTGTGTGGVGLVRPGITETTQNRFDLGAANAQHFLRGPKISYASDEKSIPYKQFSLSDQISWGAQFAGQGFQDIRQLSQTAVLYSSMLMEERMILGGRGTDTEFVGALAAPAGLTATARAAATGETGLQGGRYWIKVTAIGIWGESTLSASLDIDAVTAGNVVDVKVGTDSVGALGYRVYAARVASAGADPGDASKFKQGDTGHNTFVLQGNPLITTGARASDITADSSASALDYDGLLSTLADDGGYVKRLNAAFSSSNPGSEYNDAFVELWDEVKADPDEAILAGVDRKQLSDLLKTASSANYRLLLQQDEMGGATVGSVVTGLLNPVTGKMVAVSVHPWLPQGNSMIMSWTLPIPDSEVSETVQIVNVQDYMGIQWPVTQFSYDVSSYWFGTMIFYAPAWSGILQGIKKA